MAVKSDCAGAELPQNQTAVLVVTVGLGGPDVEASLLTPIEKSLRKAQWDRIYLLPSSATAQYAGTLKSRCTDLPIVVAEALGEGEESHPDRCFAAYDSFFRQLRANHPGAKITADFTRGTKVMSAALALAAAGHGVRNLRYISGDRMGGPTVAPGNEIVLDFRVDLVAGRRQVDLALTLLDSLQFDAADKVLPEPGSTLATASPLAGEIAALRFLSGFLGAWDRFDYADALVCLKREPKSWPAQLERRRPTEPQREHVCTLAAGLPAGVKRKGRNAPFPSSNHPDWEAASLFCWRLTADVLANARRRVATGALEDAFLRCYRALELMGQAVLFSHKIDSEDADPAHPGVASYLAQREKDSDPIRWTGKLQLARENAARLVKHLNEPLGKILLEHANSGRTAVKDRNLSVLIHGYDAKAKRSDREELIKAICGAEALLKEHGPKQLGDLSRCAAFAS